MAFIEHSGGPLDFEVEYYQGYGDAELSFNLTPDGFLGEYYRGVDLDKTQEDWARNPPHAYRFEPTIDLTGTASLIWRPHGANCGSSIYEQTGNAMCRLNLERMF